MYSPLIALDIETDTSELDSDELAAGYTSRGLDPAITPITAIAVHSSTHGTRVWSDAPEADLLGALEEFLTACPPSTIVTWNGSVFDLPFLDARARLLGLTLGLCLELDESLTPKYTPTPGYAGAYQASWARAGVPHSHLDVAYALKDFSYTRGLPWALKPVARALGFDPIEVDRSGIHRLTADELVEYVASDAMVTYELAAALLTGSLGSSVTGDWPLDA